MLQNNKILVTVAIATYNSAGRLETLGRCIEQQQDFDSSIDIQVAIFDGGSVDSTKLIANDLGFKFFDNPRGDAISAKSIAINQIRTKYLVFLDHDELLLNPDSIFRKVQLMEKDPRIKAVLTEGYEIRGKDHTSNLYASEFGDPLSAFVYRTSSLVGHRLKSFDSRQQPISTYDGASTYLTKVGSPPLLCELVACGSMINREYFVGSFPELAHETDLVPHLFYLMASASPGERFAILSNDPVGHSTSTSWQQIFRKIRWRIANRWRTDDSISEAGYKGRTELLLNLGEYRWKLFNPDFRTKLFVAYVVLVIPCMVDAIRLAIARKRLGYLMHFPLSVYVLWTSLHIVISNTFGIARRNFRYDGSTG